MSSGVVFVVAFIGLFLFMLIKILREWERGVANPAIGSFTSVRN